LYYNELKKLKLDKNIVVLWHNGTAYGYKNVNGNTMVFNDGMQGTKTSEYGGGQRHFYSHPNGAIGGGKDVSELSANIDVLTLASLLD
jgi:hypothetical protein